MEQGGIEWKKARLGKLTASRVSDVMAKSKSGWGASRYNYMAELIAERLTGEPTEGYVSSAMNWGTEKEPEAKAAYEFRFDKTIDPMGFIIHPKIEMTGASPDGAVDLNGLVETKCPNTATHIDTLVSQKVPSKYISQIQWQLACTDRQWCDFVSFDPRLPESMRLFVKRIDRDNDLISDFEKEIVKFLDELNNKMSSLIRLYGAAA